MTNIPIQAYGINLLVKMMAEEPADIRVNCPKGSPIRYGEVIARGDGFDEGANAFREMPAIKAVVAFEESAEEVEGTTSTSPVRSTASSVSIRSSSLSRTSKRPRWLGNGPRSTPRSRTSTKRS